MKREDKVAKVEELTEKVKASSALLVADYRGITVAEARQLRNEVRATGASYEVVKNSLISRAADEAGVEALKDYLDGPTAIAFCDGEAVEPARVLTRFAKELKSFEIKGGILDGQVIDTERIRFLASLPPKDVLLAQLLGGLQGPIRGLVTVLAGPARGLVTALTQIREQKEKEAA